MILKIISNVNDSIINIINIIRLIFIGDQTEMLTVCVSYDDLRCYHMPGQLWNELMCEFQLRTNAQQCNLFGLPEEDISANLEGAASSSAIHQAMHQLDKLLAEDCNRKEKKILETNEEVSCKEVRLLSFPISC